MNSRGKWPRSEKPHDPRTAGLPKGGAKGGRQRRTLPPESPGSTIRAAGLNGRVRDGNGCDPRARVTDHKRERTSGNARRWERHTLFGMMRSPHGVSWRNLDATRDLARAPRETARRRRIDPGTCLRTETGEENAGQATRGISTARLHVLPRFHLPPINVIVSHAPSEALRPGSVHLEVGFPLRCFQRLSRPDVATRRCPWRDNRYTSGRSVPVLSY